MRFSYLFGRLAFALRREAVARHSCALGKAAFEEPLNFHEQELPPQWLNAYALLGDDTDCKPRHVV